jgi:hypothetical protein
MARCSSAGTRGLVIARRPGWSRPSRVRPTTPGAGDAPGVVARLDVDAVPDGAGQGDRLVEPGRGLEQDLAPSTIGVVSSFLAGIFRAAVRDRLIVASPCDGIRLPKPEPKRVKPLATERVEALSTPFLSAIGRW